MYFVCNMFLSCLTIVEGSEYALLCTNTAVTVSRCVAFIDTVRKIMQVRHKLLEKSFSFQAFFEEFFFF